MITVPKPGTSGCSVLCSGVAGLCCGRLFRVDRWWWALAGWALVQVLGSGSGGFAELRAGPRGYPVAGTVADVRWPVVMALKRLLTAPWKFHSAAARRRPRLVNRRNPRLCFP